MTCHPPPPALVGEERISYTYNLLNRFFMNSPAQRQYHAYHGLLPVAVVVPSLYQTSCAFKEVFIFWSLLIQARRERQVWQYTPDLPHSPCLEQENITNYLWFTGLHTINCISWFGAFWKVHSAILSSHLFTSQKSPPPQDLIDLGCCNSNVTFNTDCL